MNFFSRLLFLLLVHSAVGTGDDVLLQSDRNLRASTKDSQQEKRELCASTIKCAEGFIPHPKKCPKTCIMENEKKCKSDSDCSVQCLVEPCPIAKCEPKSGKCSIDTELKGETCGSIQCPFGQVCCNASCQICTFPGSFCIQIACDQV